MIVTTGGRSTRFASSSSSLLICSSKSLSSIMISLWHSTFHSIQINSTVSSSKTELMVTIVPIINNNLIISLALRFNFSANSPTVIGALYVISVTSTRSFLDEKSLFLPLFPFLLLPFFCCLAI